VSNSSSDPNNSDNPTNSGKGLKAIVFMSSCDAVDFHYKLFSHAFWPANGREFIVIVLSCVDCVVVQ
jgi:hypothetical protein